MLVACSASDVDDDNCDINHIPSPVPNQTVRVYKVMIHKNIPAEKIGAILDAASEWVTVTDGKFAFESVFADFNPTQQPNNGEIRVYIGPQLDPKSNVIGLAWTWSEDSKSRPFQSRIWIEDDLSDRIHYLTALHEFGHALGLDHSDSKSSIMYPTITDIGEHLQCLDQKSICSLWECDSDC